MKAADGNDGLMQESSVGPLCLIRRPDRIGRIPVCRMAAAAGSTHRRNRLLAAGLAGFGVQYRRSWRGVSQCNDVNWQSSAG